MTKEFKDVTPLTPAAVEFCRQYGTQFWITPAGFGGFIHVTSVQTSDVLLCGVWMGAIQINGKIINW